MSKFSKHLIWKAMDFAKAASDELGEEFDEDRVEAMFDAFDPSLRREILLEMIKGHQNGGSIKISRNNKQEQRKIYAIKAIRAAFGYSLKDAKDLVDKIDEHGYAVAAGAWTREQYENLRLGLQDTGYSV